jgi:hypothetical protein
LVLENTTVIGFSELIFGLSVIDLKIKIMNRDTSWDDPQLSDGNFPQQNKTKFQVGDKAIKVKGYKFPCTIVSVFQTVEGNTRVVGEMDEYGLLHIFNEDQLERAN